MAPDSDVSVEVEPAPPPEVTVNIEENYDEPPEEDAPETVVIVADEISPVEEVSSALSMADQLRSIVREEISTAISSVHESIARHNHPEYERPEIEVDMPSLPEPVAETEEEEEEEVKVHPWFKPIGKRK